MLNDFWWREWSIAQTPYELVIMRKSLKYRNCTPKKILVIAQLLQMAS